MSKRRRASSAASRGPDDDSLDSNEASTSSGPTVRKRRKHSDPTEVCHQLYELLRNHKKNDGTPLCDSFIRAPKRRQEPSYYNVVANPMDLLKVQQKLRTDEYRDADDLEKDVELIVNNAKAFYKRNSPEYKDAVELWAFFNANKKKLLNGAEAEKEPMKKPTPVNSRLSRSLGSKKSATPVPSPPVKNNHNNSVNNAAACDDSRHYEELFNAVMTATDDSKKPLHPAFQLLPSKKKYPEYYEVVEQPIDLKKIAQKIQNGEYISILGLERDLMLMCKNACLFNEPTSQIYKNAKLLKKIIQTKRIEITEQYNGRGRKNSAERPKQRAPRMNLERVSKLKGEDSETENEPEPEENDVKVVPESPQSNHKDEPPADPDDPKWKLFEAVKGVAGPNGGPPLAEPFWRLPSRRFYPDYYKEIKNPVSLTQIRRKLVSKLYGTVSEVAGDMTVMFENAKKYNEPSSKLYKDAVRLQKVMQAKVQELLDIDQDFGDDPAGGKRKPGPKPKHLSPMGTPMRGRPPKDSIPLKKRLHALAKYMLDFTCEDGRKPMLAFMEKPSKKLYADYYEVIAEPIDFLEIESKIKAEQYSCERDMIKDFQLMFANCREFNEENSPIYEDATMLEKYLMDKVGKLMATPEKAEPKKERNSTPRVYKPRKQSTPLEKGLRSLFDSVRDYRDPKDDRQLSPTFQRLPSKLDYPDYFEVIREPLDLERVAHRLRNGRYRSLDELGADLALVFDNACKYNEPDSRIYKDALELQRVALQTRLRLREAEEAAPDAQAAVQAALLGLFAGVYNWSDDDGRCYSDSMTELPEHDEVDGKKVRGLSLDLLKRRLDRGVYRRLDAFQEDLFACLERARRLSRTDSQAFEDSLELQLCFVRLRDELCRRADGPGGGGPLRSSAAAYTAEDARAAFESLRRQKLAREALEDAETETRSSSSGGGGDGGAAAPPDEERSMTCNQRTFQVGEFVYLDAGDRDKCEPHILLIERLFEQDGRQMLRGNVYLRPAETFHVSTRKFLEREVFKSDTHKTVPLGEVRERCCVLSVKQYFAMRPVGYADEDVYVSESRYSTRGRNFKKIKIFPEPTAELVPRETPLEPRRVVSVFRERVEKHKDELAELQERERLVERDLPNVAAAREGVDTDDGNTYYEQYNTVCSGVVKTGDFVYVVAEGGRQVVAQIDSIWDTRDGKCYFRGPWFIYPTDIPYTPNRLYYRNEVLLSTLEDVNPLVSIVGRCCVLEYADYITYRNTEVPEADTFICVSMYDEINRQVRKLPPEGLKKYRHRPEVTEDELYYFPKPLSPPKMGIENTRMGLKRKNGSKLVDLDAEASSPQFTKMADMDVLMEDSLDNPPSVGSGEAPTAAAPTPLTGSKKKSNKNKVVTGYILYSREVRKQVIQNNPESKFGDISRIVGSEWKSLPAAEKQMWEERASRLNEETKAQLLAEERCASPPAAVGGPAATPASSSAAAAAAGDYLVFECAWDGCDWQFEELADCLEHSVKDSKDSQGHVQAYFNERPGVELQCRWRGCSRATKKNLQPFPNVARLIRHVRDMHINKGNGRSVPPDHRGKNFKPSSRVGAVSRLAPSATSHSPAGSGTTFSSPVITFAAVSTTVSAASSGLAAGITIKPAEPMFISVPPRPQRVLHSEAYIKYIEGLQSEQRFISPWERTLGASAEAQQAAPDPERLQAVATWLGKRGERREDVVAALWTLRDQLLRDTLCLHKTL